MRIYLLMLIIMLCVGTMPYLASAGELQTAEKAWENFNQLWEAIQERPEKMELLFGDHFFEVNTSLRGAYRIYIRRRISSEEIDGESRLLIDEQYFYDPKKGCYSGVREESSFGESRYIHDEQWRFTAGTVWTWGREAGQEWTEDMSAWIDGYWREEITLKTDNEGRVEIRQVGRKCFEHWLDRYIPAPEGIVRVNEMYPSYDITFILSSIGADIALGQRIGWCSYVNRLFTMARPSQGQMRAIDIGQTIDKVQWVDGQQRDAVLLDGVVRGWKHYVDASTGESVWAGRNYVDGVPAGPYWVTFPTIRISRDKYFRELRKFLDFYSITELTDNEGNPVDLPFGLAELEEWERMHRAEEADEEEQ